MRFIIDAFTPSLGVAPCVVRKKRKSPEKISFSCAFRFVFSSSTRFQSLCLHLGCLKSPLCRIVLLRKVFVLGSSFKMDIGKVRNLLLLKKTGRPIWKPCTWTITYLEIYPVQKPFFFVPVAIMSSHYMYVTGGLGFENGHCVKLAGQLIRTSFSAAICREKWKRRPSSCNQSLKL